MSFFLKYSFAMLAFLTACGASATPVKALLVVQNHVGTQFDKPLTSLTSRLSASLSGDVFEVIDPNDVVGTNQNRNAEGEPHPLGSAGRLAEALGARALITVSVDDLSDVSVAGGTVMRKSAVFSISARRVPDGAGVRGVEISAVSRNYTPTEFKNNESAVYADLIGKVCRDASMRLLESCRTIAWANPVDKVMVAFGCNFPGADVSIDGLSRGTAGTLGEPPLKLRVSPGVHRLVVSYPFAMPYAFEADFQDGTAFMITLQETIEGRKRRQQDRYFDELINRARKSGAADDFCRTEKARGYAKYLSSSHTRIAGMPQILTKWNWGDNAEKPVETGFKPLGGDEEKMQSTKELLDKAETEVK